MQRNRVWVVIKCFPLRLAAASLGYSLARYALQAYGAVSGRGAAGRLAAQQSPWSLAAIVLRAWGAALARLPEMLRRRRRIRRTRKVSRREIVRLLRMHRVALTELALRD